MHAKPKRLGSEGHVGCPLGMGAMSDLKALGLTSMHAQ